MSLDFAIYNPIDDPATHTTIFACSSASSDAVDGYPNNSTCKDADQVQAPLQTVQNNGTAMNASSLLAAAQQVKDQFDLGSCNGTTALGYSNGVVVGAYAGAEMQNQGAAAFVQKFIDLAKSSSEPQLLQVCGSNRTADFVLGVVAQSSNAKSPVPALTAVQSAMKSWSSGQCASGFDASLSTWSNTTVYQSSPLLSASNETAPTTNGSHSTSASIHQRALSPRGTCTEIKVASGDSCGSLASKCGITGAEFSQYNPSSSLCSSLTIGEWVCCSAGSLPDNAPKPQADGTCATYLVVSEDSCTSIAQANSITTTDIGNYNKQTWGWMGCADLQAAQTICLSTGNPPMPAPIANAICGPQVPGTEMPTNGTSLVDLNPCPLNACCDVYGQCGIDSGFCTVAQSPTGAPGAAPPGVAGCISNCGTNLTNIRAPSNFMKVGYFESWNNQRDCLNMDVREMAGGNYTHVHFAFANITDDFNVDVSAVQDQFELFAAMTGVKRILSFGGWSFSTSQDSYPIFRNGVTAAQRTTFANNVAAFVAKYKLDGVDFDWEYPDAPDIPGIPPGSPTDGPNYLSFLTELQEALGNPLDNGNGPTVSIAAPASYWYLKGFPIAKMQDVVNYIVYMTYDLHGQWDYGNTFSDSGCPLGGCLRSHVNLTETEFALAMITKAGVYTSQVVVGVSSYGRSFQMTSGSCTGPMCSFTGPNSGASPGNCTRTPGYIANAEIQNIINSQSVDQYHDTDSDSDIVVYGGNWVGYMSDATKSARSGRYELQQFAGAVDWAVDLQYYRVPYDPLDPHSEGIDPGEISCGNVNFSTTQPGTPQIWSDAGADVKWDQLYNDWQNSDKSENFTVFISNDIPYTSNFDCSSLLPDTNCDNTIPWPQCSNYGPAAFFILNSMINIHEWIYNMYDALMVSISSTMLTDMENFAAAFAPSNTEDQQADIAEDVAGLVFSVAFNPLWNGAFSSLDGLGEAAADSVKDIINGVMSGIIALLHDGAAGPTIAADEVASSNLYALVNNTIYGFQAMNTFLFDGNAAGAGNLSEMMSTGVFINPPGDPSATQLYNSFSTPLFAALMPPLWNISAAIFVMDSGEPCGTTYSSSVISGNMSQSTFDSSCACGTDGTLYCILILGPGAQTCFDYPSEHCTDNTFEMAPGIDSIPLNDQEQPPKQQAWTDVNVKDVIQGALNGYNNNGGKNGWNQADATNPTDLANMFNQGYLAPGVINMPICNGLEAWNNWIASEAIGSTPSAHFPCN
ncbi:MAG: hypothetical protein M1821_005749 [Bathelium mastoideum]|nr:MAG: hypothetical protein M1821_005749 [Bathelium mastoideum]